MNEAKTCGTCGSRPAVVEGVCGECHKKKSSFGKTRGVEARGNAIMRRHMETLWPEAKIESAPTGIKTQERGDFRIYHEGKGVEFIETKTEVKWTGRLFLETWSHKAMNRPGWMFTSRSDWLWYYFLDANKLYTAQMDDIKRWLYGSGDSNYPGNLERFREVEQKKYKQDNDTWGRLVPIDALYACWSFEGPIYPQAGATP